jgi:hypothetical protein
VVVGMMNSGLVNSLLGEDRVVSYPTPSVSPLLPLSSFPPFPSPFLPLLSS